MSSWHQSRDINLLWRNLRFCCRRYGLSGEAFVSGQVLLNNKFFLQFFMDNLQLEQLQTASVVEDLFDLRVSSAFLECDNFLQEMALAFCWKLFVEGRHGLCIRHARLFVFSLFVLSLLWYYYLYCGTNKMLIIITADDTKRRNWEGKIRKIVKLQTIQSVQVWKHTHAHVERLWWWQVGREKKLV